MASPPHPTPRRWWHEAPHYEGLAARLASVRAIDHHTHLLSEGAFRPELDSGRPLGQRSTFPGYAAALAERFGVGVGRGGVASIAEAARAAQEKRAAMVERLGARGYWLDHLDATNTEVALVNQDWPDGTDGARLRWVAVATTFLYPLPAAALRARSPGHERDIADRQEVLHRRLAEDGLDAVPAELSAYVGFLDRDLARLKERGAVALKFRDAYLRTLAFEDVPEARARALYAAGRAAPLGRESYLALQDYLARHIFLQAGRLGLPVHIHSSHGVPPFLRAHEADVRNLESVLTDVRFFETQFVLIHGGAPLIEDAAYLALKPHVWLDVSALPFLYPVPDLAQALRKYLTYAPEKVLFGTDVGPYPGVPVGPEVQHLALCRALREALTLALAGLVRDGMLDEDGAARLGEGVLHANARRLYGWGPTG